MFKVSLLPESYRRHLEGKKKKDIISKIALVVLVCLFITYGGIAIKGQILNSKLKKLQSANSELQMQFPALQKYQTIFNDLQSAQKMIESISPDDPDAVAFFTKISTITPDYVSLTKIDIANWFSEGVCTLTCTVQDYSDVEDYKAMFETEEMKKIIKSVQINSIQRTIDTDGNKSVSFTLILSMSTSVKASPESPQVVSNAESTSYVAAATTAPATTEKSEDKTTTTEKSNKDDATTTTKGAN